MTVSLGELNISMRYANSAGNVISKAFDARVKLNKIIEGGTRWWHRAMRPGILHARP